MEVQVSHLKQNGSKKKKSKKKWNKMFKFTSDKESPQDTKESVELDEGVVGGDVGGAEQEAEPVDQKPQILMVRTENLKHQPFEQTQELKVRLATPPT